MYNLGLSLLYINFFDLSLTKSIIKIKINRINVVIMRVKKVKSNYFPKEIVGNLVQRIKLKIVLSSVGIHVLFLRGETCIRISLVFFLPSTYLVTMKKKTLCYYYILLYENGPLKHNLLSYVWEYWLKQFFFASQIISLYFKISFFFFLSYPLPLIWPSRITL